MNVIYNVFSFSHNSFFGRPNRSWTTYKSRGGFGQAGSIPTAYPRRGTTYNRIGCPSAEDTMRYAASGKVIPHQLTSAHIAQSTQSDVTLFDFPSRSGADRLLPTTITVPPNVQMPGDLPNQHARYSCGLRTRIPACCMRMGVRAGARAGACAGERTRACTRGLAQIGMKTILFSVLIVYLTGAAAGSAHPLPVSSKECESTIVRLQSRVVELERLLSECNSATPQVPWALSWVLCLLAAIVPAGCRAW